MLVDNFEDMFEYLGLFKHPLTTCNDEVLTSLLNMSFVYVLFIEVILYDVKHGSKYS
jgi:hypothetical protein